MKTFYNIVFSLRETILLVTKSCGVKVWWDKEIQAIADDGIDSLASNRFLYDDDRTEMFALRDRLLDKMCAGSPDRQRVSDILDGYLTTAILWSLHVKREETKAGAAAVAA